MAQLPHLRGIMEFRNKLILYVTFFTTLFAVVKYVLFPIWLSQLVVFICILILAYQYYIIKPLSPQGRIKKLRQDGLYPPIEQATNEDVKNLLRTGHESAAIELYHEIHQVTRDLAKTSVDDLEPTVRQSSGLIKRNFQVMALAFIAIHLVQLEVKLFPTKPKDDVSIFAVIACSTIIIGCIISIAFPTPLFPKLDTDELTAQGLYPREGEGTDEDVARLARSGHKVPAIRLHYEIHRGSLQESSRAVKQIMRNASRN